METQNYPRFVACSMVWTTIVYATIAMGVTVASTPASVGDVVGALVIVIGFGLLIAIPVGLVTWALGWPILQAVFNMTDAKWPMASVELAGAAVALVPVSILLIFSGGEFDIFASPAVSFIVLVGVGAAIGATIARILLRARAGEQT